MRSLEENRFQEIKEYLSDFVVDVYSLPKVEEEENIQQLENISQTLYNTRLMIDSIIKKAKHRQGEEEPTRER